MAVETVCAICGNTVGTFRYRPGHDDYVHVGCKPDPLRDAAKGVFPYTLEHAVPGQKVVVENLRQLRKLESQHGFHVQAFNDNSNNFDRG